MAVGAPTAFGLVPAAQAGYRPRGAPGPVPVAEEDSYWPSENWLTCMHSEAHPLSLHRQDHFIDNAHRNVVCHSLQPEGALDSMFDLRVPIPTQAVLRGLRALHVSESHGTAVNEDHGVVPNSSESRDGALPHRAARQEALFT